MPLLADRVKETTTTTGTGTLTLAGATAGYQSFTTAFGNGVSVYYVIAGGAEWEVGIGTTGAGTLSRDTVLQSSNADALVPFSAGVKDVFCSYVADRAVTTSDLATLTNKTIDDISNFVGANQLHVKVKATENLAKGDVCKVTGWNAGENALEVARVSAGTDIAFGMTDSVINIGDLGTLVNTGFVEGLNTNSFAPGTILYPNTSGGVTSTKPSSGQYQAVAFVLRQNLNNGVVYVEFTNPQYVEVSTNTSNTLVLRDGSGNFAAGTITATLTGNASTATALSSSRTFALTGDVTGSVSSDLTSGASISTAIAAGVIVDADINASAAIADTKLATISTAGKVANSATTATAASTASTIALRNASGQTAVKGLLVDGTSSGTVTVQGAAAAGTWSLTLPTTAGSNGSALVTNGSGITSWSQPVAASTQSALSLGTGLLGTPQTTFNGATSVTASVDSTSASTASKIVARDANGSSSFKNVKLDGTSSGTVTVQPAATAGTWSLTLPTSGGTNGHFLQTNGSGVTSWAAAGGGNITVDTFNASGTWNKPATGNMALIEVWGGGGGGSNENSGSPTAAGGGSGGNYTYRIVPLTSLNATGTVTVGAGGAGAAISTSAAGQYGGDSSFVSGITVTARGGVAGQLGFAALPQSNIGSSSTLVSTSITNSLASVSTLQISNLALANGIFMGGIGNNGGAYSYATNSMYGGGGGASYSVGVAGQSQFGGNGGSVGSNGVAPAGGGGAGSGTAAKAGNGGAGRITITVW